MTRVLALNQGADNLGVVALLAWALVAGQIPTVVAVLVFVAAMGAVGAVSMRWTLFVLQGGPAVVALLVLALG